MYNALARAGVTVDYLDTRLFPQQLSLSWQPNTEVGYITLPKGKKLSFEDIHSVFWRNLGGVTVPALKNVQQQRIAYNDVVSTLRSLIQACPARWINSWQAYEFHKEKPLQLRQVKKSGVTIPATLISNDPQEIIEFARSQTKVIFKPVYGSAHTEFVTDFHLELQRLQLALSISPITLQEYIPGTNIRTYIIGETIYAAEIRSQALDFRQDLQAELIPIELPILVQNQCLAIARLLMLRWTAVDWRRTPTGEYVFLEANPSPMFLHFERQTGFAITRQLVELLVS
jgi:glutathione synthase/RimK-type ligase-like ATP-grasp enzyme